MAGRQSLPPGWVHRVRSCACVRVCVRACDQHAASECTYVHNDSKNSKHHRRLGERILSDAQCAQKNVNRNVKIRFDSPDTHARPFEKVVSLAFQTAICPCWFWSHTMMIVLRPSSKISKLLATPNNTRCRQSTTRFDFVDEVNRYCFFLKNQLFQKIICHEPGEPRHSKKERKERERRKKEERKKSSGEERRSQGNWRPRF